MKIISQLVLVIFAFVTLAACDDMGKGPNRPTELHSSQQSLK
jgi:hypothetical protein